MFRTCPHMHLELFLEWNKIFDVLLLMKYFYVLIIKYYSMCVVPLNILSMWGAWGSWKDIVISFLFHWWMEPKPFCCCFKNITAECFAQKEENERASCVESWRSRRTAYSTKPSPKKVAACQNFWWVAYLSNTCDQYSSTQWSFRNSTGPTTSGREARQPPWAISIFLYVLLLADWSCSMDIIMSSWRCVYSRILPSRKREVTICKTAQFC